MKRWHIAVDLIAISLAMKLQIWRDGEGETTAISTSRVIATSGTSRWRADWQGEGSAEVMKMRWKVKHVL